PFCLHFLAVFLAIPEGIDLGRHFEGGMLPIESLARRFDFGRAERSAMNLFTARGVWCALSDNGTAANDRRSVALRGEALGLRDGGIYGFHIVSVDVGNDVPTIALESLRRIIAKPVFDTAIDRYAVIVINHDEFGQLERAGQRAHFVGDPFHKAAVAHK